MVPSAYLANILGFIWKFFEAVLVTSLACRFEEARDVAEIGSKLGLGKLSWRKNSRLETAKSSPRKGQGKIKDFWREFKKKIVIAGGTQGFVQFGGRHLRFLSWAARQYNTSHGKIN